MVKVRVLLFGIVRQIIGEKELTLELSESPKVSELLEKIKDQYPSLNNLNSVMVAINNDYASHDQKVNSNDEIAIIPPVSGG